MTSRILAIATVLVLLLCGTGPPASADDGATTIRDIGDAIDVIPRLEESSDNLKIGTDKDSAAVVTQGGLTVDVPKDADEGIALGSKAGVQLSIGLPAVPSGEPGQVVEKGIIGFPSEAGVANAVQVVEGGGVRMLTVISERSAPTSYDYPLDLPDGGKLVALGDGGVALLDADGAVLTTVPPPFAKDANGAAVPTWFTVDGLTLTQHVDFSSAVLPVVSDPCFSCWVKTGINAVAGCVGFKEITVKGVKVIVTKWGAKYVAKNVAKRVIPGVGWVACGLGAWAELR